MDFFETQCSGVTKYICSTEAPAPGSGWVYILSLSSSSSSSDRVDRRGPLEIDPVESYSSPCFVILQNKLLFYAIRCRCTLGSTKLAAMGLRPLEMRRGWSQKNDPPHPLPWLNSMSIHAEKVTLFIYLFYLSSQLTQINRIVLVIYNKLLASRRHNRPRPSPPPRGRRSALRCRADGNVAAVSHRQHVPTPHRCSRLRLTDRRQTASSLNAPPRGGSIITMGLSRTVSEIKGDFDQK